MPLMFAVARLLTACSMCLALGTFAGFAAADEDPAACVSDPKECSRLAFNAGVAAYEKGDWPTALARFREAQALRPHPAIAFNVALAESKNGLFVEAVAHLDQILQDPQAGRQLHDQARTERDVAARSIASVVVDPGTAQGASVYLDGNRIAGDPPRAAANPGSHGLRVVVPGQPAADRSVSLFPGETLRITLDRTRELVIITGPQPKPLPLPQPPRRGVDPLWFWAAAGVTGIAGVVTLWSGLDTLRAHRAYESDFPRLDQAEVNARVAAGHDLERRTNILLGTTGVLAAGTAALGIFYTRWGTPVVRPTIGGLQVSGSF